TRLPFRTSYNCNYFADLWQGVPKDGYFTIFKKMLNHPNISVELNCDFASRKNEVPKDAIIIYTGMPDALFDFKYGALEWRSLNFDWETVPVQDFQGTTVMNYADIDVPYTRIHEFKHYHPERTIPFNSKKTIICREYPAAFRQGVEAYYPVNDERNTQIYAQYAAEAEKNSRLILGGRLGLYKYYDMDKTIANALNAFENLLHV
ncbi:MAG: UDP-galactopyranose mutase, partial [Desulfovibrio sp.]|nr:UDP-galactopyranose mutase [Desulfovibrio sp.]